MDNQIKQKLDNFFNQYKFQKYKKGQVLLNPGTETSSIFYLTQGVVKRYAISDQGEELILNIYRPVAFFPISQAINSTPNRHYFEALTNIEVWEAPKNKVVDFLQQQPTVLFDLLARIYSGLEGLFLRMEYLMGGSAEKKIITELVIAASRFGSKKDQQTTIDLKLTEAELAAQTGVARETVSRVIHELKNKGLIDYKRS